MQNQNAIMAVVNKNYLHPLKTMWASLFSTNNYPIDFYLFYEDLNDNDIASLSSFVSHYPKANFIPMPMGSEILQGLPTTDEFPKEIYFKLLGLDLLPKELHHILCMDLDMVVTKDISDVFSLDVSACGMAACPDIFGQYYGLEENNLDCLGLSYNPPYFNAGFMLFSLDFIRQIGGGEAIIRLAHLHKGKLYYPEQDILNILFHDSYLQLPWSTYNCPPLFYAMDATAASAGDYRPLEFFKIQAGQIPEGYLDFTESIYENAAVIHYMGGTKPWKKDRESALIYAIFDEAYNQVADSLPQD